MGEGGGGEQGGNDVLATIAIVTMKRKHSPDKTAFVKSKIMQ